MRLRRMVVVLVVVVGLLLLLLLLLLLWRRLVEVVLAATVVVVVLKLLLLLLQVVRRLGVEDGQLLLPPGPGLAVRDQTHGNDDKQCLMNLKNFFWGGDLRRIMMMRKLGMLGICWKRGEENLTSRSAAAAAAAVGMRNLIL